MNKILTDVERITTRIEFDLLKNHINALINEATDKGFLSDPNESNDYTREIARLAKIGARYESEFLNLSYKSTNPLVREIENAIQNRGITQRKAAELIGVNEPTFSSILRGKRRVSMKVAKRILHEFQIDPLIIIEYA